jgi:hypothetical protein
MLWLSALLILSGRAWAVAPSVPFYLQDIKTDRDIGAVNQNFRAMSDYIKTLSGTSGTSSASSWSGGSVSNPSTFTASVAFQSSVTINGGMFKGGYSIFNNDVENNMTSTDFSSFSFGPCVTGSTRTIETGGHAFVWASVNFYATQPSSVRLNFLVDGGYYSPYSASVFPASKLTTSADNSQIDCVGFNSMVSLSPGTHTFCLMGATSATHAYIPYSGGEFGVLSLP